MRLLHKGDVELKDSNFQIVGLPVITELNFQLNKEYEFNEGDTITLDMANNIEVLRRNDTDSKEARVTLELLLFLDSDFKDVPFNLKLSAEGHFVWDESLHENHDQLDILLNQNAPAIIYSYLRPVVTSTTLNAGLPPLVIPLINFVK